MLAYFSGDRLGRNHRPTLRLNLTNSRVAEYITYRKTSRPRSSRASRSAGRSSKDKLWFFGSYQPRCTDTERRSTLHGAEPPTATFSQKTRSTVSTSGQPDGAADQQPARARRLQQRWSEDRRACCRPSTVSEPDGTNYAMAPDVPELERVGQRRLGHQQQLFCRRARRLLPRGLSTTTSVSEEPRFNCQRRPTTSVWPACRRACSAATGFTNIPTNRASTQNNQTRAELPGRQHLLRATSAARTRQGRRPVRPHRATTCSRRDGQPGHASAGTRAV